MAIATVLISLAAPNLKSVIDSNRKATELNDFVASAHLARSEAIKRSSNVALCLSVDGERCTSSGNWEDGYIVFVDRDGDVDRDPAPAADEQLLRVIRSLPNGFTLRGSTAFANSLFYRANGFPGNRGGFVLCLTGEFNTGRAIIISPTGRLRARIIDPSNSSTRPEKFIRLDTSAGLTALTGFTSCTA